MPVPLQQPCKLPSQGHLCLQLYGQNTSCKNAISKLSAHWHSTNGANVEDSHWSHDWKHCFLTGNKILLSESTSVFNVQMYCEAISSVQRLKKHLSWRWKNYVILKHCLPNGAPMEPQRSTSENNDSARNFHYNIKNDKFVSSPLYSISNYIPQTSHVASANNVTAIL
jgi:hypothetical protein